MVDPERDRILAVIREHEPELRHHGVRSLALFGSAARDELTPESDVDVLVEFDGPATFDSFMDVRELLERLTGRSIDLVTTKAMKPALWENVRDEAVYA